jgi:hypothetical protein
LSEAGITAASVHVVATDSSSIDAFAGAASLAAGFGSTAGVAVAIGLSLAFNEVSNEVEAYILDADQGLTATVGGVTISAQTVGGHLFDLSLGSLTADKLDDAATVDVHSSAFKTSDGTQDVREAPRRSGPGLQRHPGEPDRIYRYIVAATATTRTTSISASGDYRDTSKWRLLQADGGRRRGPRDPRDPAGHSRARARRLRRSTRSPPRRCSRQ